MKTTEWKQYFFFKIHPLLKNKKIYIIPSAQGFYYLFCLALVFLISLIYGHSLAYSLTFFLFSLTAIAAVMSNDMLKGVEVKGSEKPCYFFAKQEVEVKFLLTNRSTSLKSFFISDTKGLSQNNATYVSLSPGETQRISYLVGSFSRGVYQKNQWYLASALPFNLFFTWSPFSCSQIFIIAPKPYDPQSEEDFFCIGYPQNHREHSGENVFSEGVDEFYQHQKREQKESAYLNRIDWKIYAKKREFFQKKFIQQSGRTQKVVIDGEHPLWQNFSLEEKLSRLMGLILYFEKKEVIYQLRLKNSVSDFSCGGDHLRQTMRWLADA